MSKVSDYVMSPRAKEAIETRKEHERLEELGRTKLIPEIKKACAVHSKIQTTEKLIQDAKIYLKFLKGLGG